MSVETVPASRFGSKTIGHLKRAPVVLGDFYVTVWETAVS